MHPTAYRKFDELLEKWAKPAETWKQRWNVIDIGSYDLNGTLRPMIEGRGWNYAGLDLCEGPNVDIISAYPYKFPVQSGAFDLVISNATIEHVESLRAWMHELYRICRTGGLVILQGPLALGYHAGEVRHNPYDFWRIYPDGMNSLLSMAEFFVLEVDATVEYCWGVGKKAKRVDPQP